MKNFTMFYIVMIFLLPMLDKYFIVNLKMINMSLHNYMLMIF